MKKMKEKRIKEELQSETPEHGLITTLKDWYRVKTAAVNANRNFKEDLIVFFSFSFNSI